MSCWRSQNSWLRTRRTLHSTSLTQTGTTLGSILRGRCESWMQRTSLWSTNWPLKPVSVYKFSAVIERILFDRENILQDAGGVCRMFIYMLVSRCTLQTTSFQMSCSQHCGQFDRSASIFVCVEGIGWGSGEVAVKGTVSVKTGQKTRNLSIAKWCLCHSASCLFFFVVFFSYKLFLFFFFFFFGCCSVV